MWVSDGSKDRYYKTTSSGFESTETALYKGMLRIEMKLDKWIGRAKHRKEKDRQGKKMQSDLHPEV